MQWLWGSGFQILSTIKYSDFLDIIGRQDLSQYGFQYIVPNPTTNLDYTCRRHRLWYRRWSENTGISSRVHRLTPVGASWQSRNTLSQTAYRCPWIWLTRHWCSSLQAESLGRTLENHWWSVNVLLLRFSSYWHRAHVCGYHSLPLNQKHNSHYWVVAWGVIAILA